MKTHKIISIAVALGLLVSCGDRLDVTNPNKFTVEDINENIFLSGDESKIKLALEGMANTMPVQMMIYDTKLTKGYGNRWSADATHQLAHDMLIGDIVSGPDAGHAGVFSNWYSVASDFPYYRYNADVVANYANYISACVKISNAIKVMQNISEETIAKSSGATQAMLKDYRARCLVVYALGYMELMEIYTDLSAPDSETAKGWPIYENYAYNTPVAPLSVKETWDRIIADLQTAVKYFNESIGYTLGNTESTLYDIDLGVAQYLLARAALDCHRWDIAATAANDIVSHYPNFISEENWGMSNETLESVAQITADHGFLDGFNSDKNAFFNFKVNPEVILGWEASESVGANVTRKSAIPFVLQNPLLNGNMQSAWQIDADLYNKIPDADFRKDRIASEDVAYPFYTVNTVGSDTTFFSGIVVPKYTNLKYAATESRDGKTIHDNSTWLTDFPYYRSSAAYLMLAEAYAQQGNTSGAKAALDKLLAARTKKGSTPMTSNGSLDDVKLQWRIEFWGESNWSFLNAKRWGDIANYRKGTNHWAKSVTPTLIWEVPEEETIGNPYWN
jgi:tetratricopeptide (TPR) repeat protein